MKVIHLKRRSDIPEALRNIPAYEPVDIIGPGFRVTVTMGKPFKLAAASK